MTATGSMRVDSSTFAGATVDSAALSLDLEGGRAELGGMARALSGP